MINAITTKFCQSPTKHSNFATPLVCTISFILLMQFNMALLLRFLVYLHLNFTLSLNLIYSINHFLLSLFHSHLDGQFSGSIWLSSVLFISQSFSLYHSQPFHFHRFTAEYCYTVSGNKPPSNLICLVGFCRHFKSPHSFRCYHLISSHFVYIHLCYHLIFMWGLRIVYQLLYLIHVIYFSSCQLASGTSQRLLRLPCIW